MKTARTAETVGIWACIAVALAFALVPLLWGLSTSLKDPAVAEAFPPTWWPDAPTFDNYLHVLRSSNFPRYLFNSVVLALATIVCTLIVAIPAGYAAARWAFPAKRSILLFILSMGMIPGVCVMVPLYLLTTFLGLFDTYTGLILVYTAWQIPTAIWILRGFFQTLPRELEEAAYIDGCTRFEALRRIILPLCQPGVAAVAIIVFIYVWNEFLLAYALTISDDRRTAQSGLYLFVTSYGIEWSNVMAAAVMTLAPPALAFAVLQSRFIHGMTNGALK